MSEGPKSPEETPDMERIFSKPWRKGMPETPCGKGAKLEHTESARLFVQAVVRTYDIRTINDAGCGDCNWIRHVGLENVDYMGYDVVLRNLDEIVWPGSTVAFEKLDITHEDMRGCDLILCRHVLTHLPTDLALAAVERFKRTARYLLATTFPGADNDKRHKLRKGKQAPYSKMDLSVAPFNLGDPIQTIQEDIESHCRLLCLWSLSDV